MKSLQTASQVPQHCGICGNTHSGNCHPDAFNYYRCNKCQGVNRMPFDACFGFENIYCCSNDVSAADTWEPITFAEYQQAESVAGNKPIESVCAGIVDGFGTRNTCKKCAHFKPELAETSEFKLDHDICRWRIGTKFFIQFQAKEGGK